MKPSSPFEFIIAFQKNSKSPMNSSMKIIISVVKESIVCSKWLYTADQLVALNNKKLVALTHENGVLRNLFDKPENFPTADDGYEDETNEVEQEF